MAEQLQQGVVMRKPAVQLTGKVECDEVYVMAGHKDIWSTPKNAVNHAK